MAKVQGGEFHPPHDRGGIGGRTCSCPTSPQSRHLTRIGRRSDPLPWLTYSPSGNTRIAARVVGRELVAVIAEAARQ
jgi:hypothetical protein